MRLILIDQEAQDKLAKMVAFANANVVQEADILDMVAGKRAVVGDVEGYFCFIPDGVKIVLSIEQHETPERKLCRHLSVSVNGKDALPNPHVMELIMGFCGFKKQLSDCHLAIEDLEHGHAAINVLEIIE